MIVLVTGGSACGKSSFAEALAMSLPAPHYYIATMQPFSAWDQQRIARHLELRADKDFITVERYTGLDALELPHLGGTALLECLCNLTSNEMFAPETWEQVDPVPAVMRGVQALARTCENVVIVTNDVGSCVPDRYSEQTKDYVRALGTVNCKVAALASAVVEFVAGSPVVVKGALDCVDTLHWTGAPRWDGK